MDKQLVMVELKMSKSWIRHDENTDKTKLLHQKIMATLNLMREIYREKPTDSIRRKLDVLLRYLYDTLDIIHEIESRDDTYGKTKVAWFLWKEYFLPGTYKLELEELIGIVLHIRGLEVVEERNYRILEKDETAITKFVVNITATDGDAEERLEIMYDRGEVEVYKIE